MAEVGAGGVSAAAVTAMIAAANLAPALGTYTTLFSGMVDMSLTTDQALSIPQNVVFANYAALLIVATKASAPILLATGGIYTGVGKIGTIVVAATQVWTGLTSTVKVVKPTLTTAGQDLIVGNTLYFALTTPMATSATAFISVMGLPGN